MANGTHNSPLFGLNINPDAADPALAFNLARYADAVGLDIIGV